MKLAFISELPSAHYHYWCDGLKGALNYLQKTYDWEIDFYNITPLQNPEIKVGAYDFGLFWGAFSRPQHRQKVFRKQGLCFGGGPTNHEYARNFDIIFAESAVDLKEFIGQGLVSTQAFGTNTQVFKPIPDQPKTIDTLYPAAFALWKRHDLYAQHVVARRRGGVHVAVGYIQPNNHEYECVQVCLDNGITVIPWVPAESLVWLYNASKEVVVTADAVGGGQRTVLEAKACGIPFTLGNEAHPKLAELASLSREDILRDWSEVNYAEQLKEGIESCL